MPFRIRHLRSITMLEHSPWIRWAMLAGVGLVLALGIALYQGYQMPPSAKTSVYTQGLESRPLAERWILNGEEAIALIRKGATLLDARGMGLHMPLPGAIVVRWQQFSQSTPLHQGKLLADDAQLSALLQDVGISGDRPVIVVADPRHGWGEDGRIVWMLRTLGHPQAFMVDGGVQALWQAGLQPSDVAPHQKGTFTVQRKGTWEVSAADVQTHLQQPSSLIVVDARSHREFNGEVPYGETRGGHVPQAIHLHYRELLDPQGYLLPREVIRTRLEEMGVLPNSAIASYCTGGIRSGWLTVVLADLGFTAKNYAGSMWEWSALPADQYPLE